MKRILVLAIIAITAMISLSCTNDSGTEIKTFQLYGGQKLKIEFQYEGPKELSMEIKEFYMDNTETICIKAVLENTSPYTVVIVPEGVTFWLDNASKMISSWMLYRDKEYALDPGESVEVYHEVFEYSLNSKAIIMKVEARVEDKPLSETETDPAQTKTTTTAYPNFKYIKNPDSPGEFLYNFCYFCGEGDFLKAIGMVYPEEYITEEYAAGMEKDWNEVLVKGDRLLFIEIKEERINGDYAEVDLMLFFEEEGETPFYNVSMEKSGKKWILK